MENLMNRIKVTECPRDAMQGIHDFIPTAIKTQYINKLLKVGFDVVDFGSFVSPKAIPQLRDTAEVLAALDLTNTKSKLLSIVANARGAESAANFPEIDIIGFPFSVSETFQLRNTNSTREEALITVDKMLQISSKANQRLRVYISMGFGNPYGDFYSDELVLEWGEKLKDLGVTELALSDTIGASKPDNITAVIGRFNQFMPDIELSAHLHSAPHNWKEKIDAAFKAGCFSFDAAIKGFGGCPMAKDELVGNLATENLIQNFSTLLNKDFSQEHFLEAMDFSKNVFG